MTAVGLVLATLLVLAGFWLGRPPDQVAFWVSWSTGGAQLLMAGSIALASVVLATVSYVVLVSTGTAPDSPVYTGVLSGVAGLVASRVDVGSASAPQGASAGSVQRNFTDLTFARLAGYFDRHARNRVRSWALTDRSDDELVLLAYSAPTRAEVLLQRMPDLDAAVALIGSVISLDPPKGRALLAAYIADVYISERESRP